MNKRIPTISVLILFSIWFGRSYDHEPAIGLITTLVVLGFFERNEYQKKKDNLWDQQLFQNFISIFPSNKGSVFFLRDYDLGNSFRASYLDPIIHFIDTWNNAEKEFQNKRIENKKKEFYSKLKCFSTKLYERASPTHDPEWYSIGMKDMENRNELFIYRDEINRLATEAYKLHQEFVRLAIKNGIADKMIEKNAEPLHG